jgi:hypothetical protein
MVFKRAVPILLITLLLIAGCVATKQNMHSTNLTVEQEVIALMEQYEVWYQLAPEEVKAEWKKVFDPAFQKLDLLMDTYNNMVRNGMTTVTIIGEINRVKTQIMMELVRRQANEG